MAEADDTEETGASAAPAEAPADVPASSRAPAESGPDFTSMVKAPGEMGALQSRLSEIQRAKSAASASVADETTRRLDADRARMEAAYKASATMPEELTQNWDAKAKMAEHSTDPVTAFGSVGSVFAMLASSFAGLPMEHALNAGAAAINAVHAGDERAYQKEYDAWQKNTNLAIKRHEIQHQAYTDATNLMNSNINAGRTKMELAATKYGDQKAQALLDAGMDKELFELISTRNKAALNMQSEWDKVQLQHEKVMDLKSDPRYSSGDIAQKSAAIQDWNQRWSPNGAQKLRYDAKADYIAAQKRAKPDWTPDDMLQWNKDFATAEEGDTGGPTDINSSQKLKAAAVKEIFDKAKESGNPISLAEAERQYKLKTTTMSGNRIDDIDKQINMFDNGKSAIDKALGIIDKHWGSVGVAGYATRGAERVSNIFGSNETDRSQLAHEIQYLQTIAPRLMNDASSRGLKAEADKIGAIIAGLNLGDTTANTKRALSEVRELWDKMQQDNMARRRGEPNAPPAPGSGGAPGAGGAGGSSGAAKPKWQQAPIVTPAGPRAEAESDVAYG
jgi:hypothetical protein